MGVGVMQTKNEMFLEQSAYTKALLSRFGMDKANSVATPVDINADLVTTSDEVEECDKDLYQSAVGIEIGDGRALKGVGVGDAEAVSTAVHNKNRSPTSAHKDLTPYQALNGHKPSVQRFRTFGCMANAHVPKDEREKLDRKSKTCVLLGYGSGTKGYRLYDFKAKKVLLSRDVVFNESQFMSFEKEPSKEIECVPCSFPQEEKHGDSERELELCHSTRNRGAPDRFGEWVSFAQDKFDVPANVEEALHGPESKLWKAAMEEEMSSMNINNIWSLVECPKNKKPIRCKWIFKKENWS
ncbi:hypothetical protein FHG87_018182 [Trinorchestia longiramus]|nr:hypothetical protein FHG87_018182 [Trinorchestia longiramus]